MPVSDIQQWALGAAQSSLARLSELPTESDHLERVYVAAGETLLWVCLIEESFWNNPNYAERRDRDQWGYVFPGLRFLRNNLVHSPVVSVHLGGNGGLEYPLFKNGFLNYDTPVFRWVEGLEMVGTSGHKREQFEGYRKRIAGEVVGKTLRDAVTWCDHELAYFGDRG